MALFDVRCESCDFDRERKGTFADVESIPCEECGSTVKVVFKNMNLSQDATPTRGYGRTSTHPALVRHDGTAVNPGHEPVTADMLRLTKDQVKRLEL